MARQPIVVKHRLAERTCEADPIGLPGTPMMRMRQSVFLHRHMAMFALVLALALRALIPQGFMTAPDAARGITIMLCDGSGATARLAVPIGEKPEKVPSSQSCPFAVLDQTAAADAPGGWTITQVMQPVLQLASKLEPAGPTRNQHAHPPARAPPITA